MNGSVNIAFSYKFNSNVTDRRWVKLYITDGNNNRIVVVSAITQQTTAVITSTNSSLSNPYGVAVDSNGQMYVSDRNNNRLVKFALVMHFVYLR